MSSTDKILQVEILNLRSGKRMCTMDRVANVTSILGIKEMFKAKYPEYYASRQTFRLSKDGKALNDTDTLADLNLTNECILYFKDRGPQIAWSTVFYCEYGGPLVMYLLFYIRPGFIYGDQFALKPSKLDVVKLACICHTFHFTKRLLETKFVHRFSHGTMPLSNIFKNSIYYWGFAAWMSYYINHPKYTPPMYGDTQVYIGLIGFIVCELGNLSIHLSFRSMRPKGTTKRVIPQPSSNPFTWLFSLVSCPNYTYEVGIWLAFTIMTQTLAAALFTLAGFLQMAQWALAKHRNYRREFPNYPRSRKAIIPFFL